MKKLELVRLKDREYLSTSAEREIEHLRVWYCNYRSFDFIKAFDNVSVLEIAGYADADLSIFSNLPKLEKLSILHAPKLKNIDGVVHCRALRYFSLETNPSWDGRKKMHLDSVRKLSESESLEVINFMGVVVDDGSYECLLDCKNLKAAFWGGVSASKVQKLLSSNRISYEPTYLTVSTD